MTKPTIADLLAVAGIGLIAAAITALAGVWWAVLGGGIGLVYLGWVQHANTPPKKGQR